MGSGGGGGGRLQGCILGLFVFQEIGQHGMLRRTCRRLICHVTLEKLWICPLPNTHAHTYTHLHTHPGPTDDPFADVLHTLRSERVLGSRDKALKINWGRDME